ncbi:DUF1353 domain-containing protein [Campylobacter jejuni]|nr:DUF1353 domain-containing protein [Campylobacter jejuni]
MIELKRVVIKPFDKDKFEVVENYKFDLNVTKGVIEQGYKTDGASIPRIFWSLYPPYKSEYFTACVIHDWLCSKAMHEKSIKNAYKLADLALKEAMLSLGVSRFTTYTFYYWCKYYHILKCFLKGYE